MSKTKIVKPKRSCGDCDACCVALELKEIQKPERTRCPNLVGHRCGIYETRPAACRGFECLWRFGMFKGTDRPDRLGVVIWAPSDLKRVVLSEVKVGALETPYVRDLIRTMESKFPEVLRVRAEDGQRRLTRHNRLPVLD